MQDLIAFLEDECYLHSQIRVHVAIVGMHSQADFIKVIQDPMGKGYRIVGEYDG